MLSDIVILCCVPLTTVEQVLLKYLKATLYLKRNLSTSLLNSFIFFLFVTDKESMIIASDNFPGHDISDLSPLTSCGFIHVSPKGQIPNGVDHLPDLKHTNNLFFSNELQKCFRGK